MMINYVQEHDDLSSFAIGPVAQGPQIDDGLTTYN